MSGAGDGKLSLTLTMLAWPDGAKPEQREISRACKIGRLSAECDWVLPDPRQVLSRLHCEVVQSGGAWRVIDRSGNGTFLNDETQAIGRDQTRPLHDGDRIRLGAFVIEARANLSPQLEPPPGGNPFEGFGRAPASGALDGDWAQPRMPPAAEARMPPAAEPRMPPAAEPHMPPVAQPPMQAWPADPFPPSGRLDDEAHGEAGGGFAGPANRDQALPVHHLWQPPPRSHLLGDGNAGPPPEQEVRPGGLPPDWDQEKLAGEAPRAAASPAAPAPTAPCPEDASRNAPLPPQPLAADMDLLAAFLRGARLPAHGVADPARTMEQVGAALRALVAGLHQVRAARATVKREFRIADTTILSPDQQNPLRTIQNDDDALRALLSLRYPPALAVEDVLARARLHELALVAAMRDAVEGLLDTLSPAKVAAADPADGGFLLADRRKARAWDSFVALHQRTSEAMRDDFDSVFGKAFARAYERVVQQASGGAKS